MKGRFELKKSGATFMFNLFAPNGRIILTSERYKSKAGAMNGIKSVKKNARKKGQYDRRTAKNGKSLFCLCAANGEVIGRSQMYAGPSGVRSGMLSVQSNASGAKIHDLT